MRDRLPRPQRELEAATALTELLPSDLGDQILGQHRELRGEPVGLVHGLEPAGDLERVVEAELDQLPDRRFERRRLWRGHLGRGADAHDAGPSSARIWSIVFVRTGGP